MDISRVFRIPKPTPQDGFYYVRSRNTNGKMEIIRILSGVFMKKVYGDEHHWEAVPSHNFVGKQLIPISLE